MGTFYPFEDDESVKLYGVEAAGEGLETGKHAASLGAGAEGVFHGMLNLRSARSATGKSRTQAAFQQA